MSFYLLNSPILTDYGQWRYEGPLDATTAKQMIPPNFISAIGHEATAQVLSQILEKEVANRRVQVQMARQDQALIFKLKDRLPAGCILNTEELAKLPYEMGLLTRLA